MVRGFMKALACRVYGLRELWILWVKFVGQSGHWLIIHDRRDSLVIASNSFVANAGV